MSQATCKNCGALLTDKYCHKCGQKASTSRISLKSLGHEITHSLTHIENGFFYTTIELFIHPGKVVNEYLSGKRKNYNKPFSLYFIWVGIYILVDNIIKKEVHYKPLNDLPPDTVLYESYKAVYPFYEHYLAIISLPLIIILPVFGYLFITRKLGYNYAETLIMGIYLSSVNYVCTIAIQVFGAFTGTYAFIQENQLFIFATALYGLWAVFDIIKRKPYWKSCVLSVLNTVIGFIIFYCYFRYLVPFIVSLFL